MEAYGNTGKPIFSPRYSESLKLGASGCLNELRSSLMVFFVTQVRLCFVKGKSKNVH